MLGTIVRTTTSDQIPLEGMYFEPESARTAGLVLHTHGSLGNFYGNPFIDHCAEVYTRRGFGFLSVNNRGHDIGGVTERFTDCIQDLEAWFRFSWSRGYERVVLQGHSLGALKAAHFATTVTVERPRLDGLLLLSPFDVVAFYCLADLSKRPSRLATARDVAATDPADVMPRSFWDAWPISAGTFIDLVGEKTIADMFPFREGNLSDSCVSRCPVPIFAAIGEADFAAYPTPGSCIDQLAALKGVTTTIIPQAPHNFAGHEDKLMTAIMPWLTDHVWHEVA